jgi:hypothetical protein
MKNRKVEKFARKIAKNFHPKEVINKGGSLIVKHQALEQASVCLYQGRNVGCIFH